MMNSPEMLDSVNSLIHLMHSVMADRRVTIEGISEQLAISMGIIYKIVHDDFVSPKIWCYSFI